MKLTVFSNMGISKFIDACKICVTKKYYTFSGRASRSEFWYFSLGNVVIWLIAALICDGIFWIAYLALILPNIAVSIRRLHDTNRSGWWYLIAFLPLIGPFILLYFYVCKGTDGNNRFGEDPMAITLPSIQ